MGYLLKPLNTIECCDGPGFQGGAIMIPRDASLSKNYSLKSSIPFTGLLQTNEFHFQCCEIQFQTYVNRIQNYEIEYHTIEIVLHSRAIQFQIKDIQFHTHGIHF